MQRSKFSIIHNQASLPKLAATTLHSFNFNRTKPKPSPEPKVRRLHTLTFDPPIMIKKLLPHHRKPRVALRTISLHKLTDNRITIQQNCSLDLKGWSHKSALELFDI